MKIIVCFLILVGCGKPSPNFENTCDINYYAGCRSEVLYYNELHILEAEKLARDLLFEAGVVDTATHDQKISSTTLLIHATSNWYDSWGRYVSGESNQNAVEVGIDLSALLHEEIHMAHAGELGNAEHANWDKFGYFGLDVFFTDTIAKFAWGCTPGSGMTRAMVDSLRNRGRPIDEFLKYHPSCLNDN